MDTDSDSDNTDDEVEQELDVFLSKRLQGKLYLLQYPVKTTHRPFGQKERVSAKIKPNNNKLEVDISLDISSPSYDQGKGEQIALNVDGNDATSQTHNVFDTNVMDKQTLQSTAVPASGKRYVCGVMHDGRVHLTPISHVLQLRPSFKYMDQAEHRAARAAKAKEAAEADSSQDEADDAKAVTLRIKGAESEAARLARERSYAAYEKRLADEKWRPLTIFSSDAGVAELERRKLLCQTYISRENMMDQTIPEIHRTPSEYLDSLRPVYAQHSVDNTAMPDNVLSVSLLKHESLGNQIKLILKNAKIINFSHLLSIMHGTPDPTDVVRSLQSYAVLIKGRWIVKSEILFPPETVSPISGTPAEHLCRSRDYILYMFTVKDFLARKEITDAVKIPGEDVKAMLMDIAVMRVGQGWSLRLTANSDFEHRFPGVSERQNMLWNAMAAKLAKQMPDFANEARDKSGKGEKTPSRKKKTSFSGDEKSSMKSPKTPKKQRKPSGASASNSKVNQETISPTRVPSIQVQSRAPVSNAPFVQLNGVSESNGNSANGLTPMFPPSSSVLAPNTQILTDLKTLPPDINIDNVTSTVQSIANEIYKRTSPNRLPAFVQQNDSPLPFSGAASDFYVKQEKHS